ncbi:MAG: transcription antitermination factor NusB [Deltaproteobacteria bacterium]
MALSRRKARIAVLEMLYQLDMTDGDVKDITAAQFEEKNLAKDSRGFIVRLVNGVWEHRSEIDRLIEANAENWSVYRITLIDRNILRLAVFEMVYCPDIPFKVAIDEAIELGKIYGAEDSGAFINGILDKIAQGLSLKKEEIGSRGTSA